MALSNQHLHNRVRPRVDDLAALKKAGRFWMQVIDTYVVDEAPQHKVAWNDGKAFRKGDTYEPSLRLCGMAVSYPIYKGTLNSTAYVFGTSRAGFSVCVQSPFRPSLVLEPINNRAVTAITRRQLERELQDHHAVVESISYKHTYGWEPENSTSTKTKQYHGVRVSLPNRRATYRIQEKPPHGWRVLEGPQRIRPQLQFCDGLSLKMGGWLEVDMAHCDITPYFSHVSTCQLELHASDPTKALITPDEQPSSFGLAPLVIASFDGEMYSHDGNFPEPEEHRNPIIQIGTVVSVGGVVKERVVFTTKPQPTPANMPDAQVIHCQTEAAMLEQWRDYVALEIDPDIVLGFNICGFDWNYLAKRANLMCRCQGKENSCRFFQLSRIWSLSTPPLYKTRDKGRVQVHMPMAGRVEMDLFAWVQKEYKLRSYSLNNVALEFLNDQKVSLPAKEIFAMWDGPVANQAKMVEYVLHDCELPLMLVEKLDTVVRVLEMAVVTFTSPYEIMQFRQQVRVFNQVVYYAHRGGYVVNEPPPYAVAMADSAADEKYQGATVLEPITGFHVTPTATLDFQSLYPMSMKYGNLCCSTWVGSPAVLRELEARKGTEYEVPTRTWEMNGGRSLHTFVQHERGVLPEMLTLLLSSRRLVKRAMKAAAKGGHERNVLNARQLAIKISANSVYGFTGARGETAMYPCMAVAETTTCIGREALETTQRLITAPRTDGIPKVTVRYGDTDSVMICFEGVTEVAEAMAFGTTLAQEVTDHFDGKQILEMECVKNPFLLLKRKRYAAIEYEPGNEKAKLKCSGIETVRRDYSPLASETAKKILTALMNTRKWENAMACFEGVMLNLYNNEIPIAQLTQTCKLKGEYANKNLPQITVRDLIHQRNPGSEPQAGDRVGFVVVHRSKLGKQPTQKFKRVDDPSYVQQQMDARKAHGSKAGEHVVPDRAFYAQEVGNILKKFLAVIPEADVDRVVTDWVSRIHASVTGCAELKFTPLQGTHSSGAIPAPLASFVSPDMVAGNGSVRASRTEGPQLVRTVVNPVKRKATLISKYFAPTNVAPKKAKPKRAFGAEEKSKWKKARVAPAAKSLLQYAEVKKTTK